MTRILPPALQSLTINGGHRLVRCWRWTRADGEILRFTEHPREIVLDGQTYSPVGGFKTSSEAAEDGLVPGSRELMGVVTDERITEEDLRAGRYHGCRIDEFCVDARFPWAGVFRTNVFYISEVKFGRYVWEAEVDGPLFKLQVTRGYTYERACRWEEFGGEACGFDLSTEEISAEIVSVETDRRSFTTDVPTGKGDDFYNAGRITFTSGANDGLQYDVKDYVEADGVITLHIETAYDVEVGDTFDLVPGCDRQSSTCKAYENFPNFGGFHKIPGNNKLFETPDQKLEDE